MTIVMPVVDPTSLCPSSNHSSSSLSPDSSQNSSIQNIFEVSSFNPSNSPKISEKVDAKPLHKQFENLGFLNPTSKSNLKEFNDSFESFVKGFDELDNSLKDYGTSLHHILAVPEYLDVNGDLINDMILSDQSSQTKVHINNGKEAHKWIEGFSLLVLHGYKCYKLSLIQKEFKEQVNNFIELRKNLLDDFKQEQTPEIDPLIKSIEKDLDVLKGRFSLAYEDVSYSKIFKKSQKSLSKVAGLFLSYCCDHSYKICKYSLGIIGRLVDLVAISLILSKQSKWISHLKTPYRIDKTHSHAESSSTIHNKIHDFINSLKKCETLEKVQETLEKNGITDIELPLTFDQWTSLILYNKRFQRQLTDSFCYAIGKNPFMDEEAIASRLEYQKKRHEVGIAKAEPIINKHLEACSEKENFEEIKVYFEKINVDFSIINFKKEANLPLPPKNREDWLQCVQSDQFRRALADQWVHHQEGLAQLSLQAVRQIALSKNKVENEFLRFRKWENIASIATNLIQLMGYLPYQTARAGYACLCFIVKDISKIKIPGLSLLYIGHPLYADKSFKSDGILLMLAEHALYGSKYKPNEYSLEGYKVSVLINWYFLVGHAYQLISVLQQVILWLNIRLVENCIMDLKTTPFFQDARYIKISQATCTKREQCHEKIAELKESLEALRIKDGKLIISTDSKQQDPIQELTDSLGDADFNFFSSEVKESFEDNFGIDLNSSNPSDIKSKLEEFVSQGEEQFVAQYQANRFSHLHR